MFNNVFNRPSTRVSGVHTHTHTVKPDQNQCMLTLEQIKQRPGGLAVLCWPRSPLTSLSHSSFGGCISGDMTPPTRLRTPWLEFVIREAWSSARWSIHITTFLSGSPGRGNTSRQKTWKHGTIHNTLFEQCMENFSNGNLQTFFLILPALSSVLFGRLRPLTWLRRRGFVPSWVNIVSNYIRLKQIIQAKPISKKV